MKNIKQINIKNRTHYFFNDMISIKNLNPDLQKRDKKVYKNIDICYIGYITIKNIGNYESIDSVNALYFIIGEVNGYIEEKNWNKYLVFPSKDKNKELLTKYTELWKKN